MRMKKLLYIAMALMAVTGCAKALDNVTPKHAISSDKVGEGDLNKLTNGVLYNMESCASNGWWDGDKMGEVFRNGPGGAAFTDVLVMTPSTDFVSSRWNKYMTTLWQVNELLGSASGVSSAAASNARMKGCFCRAWIYYQMYIRWGTAPILEKPSNEEVPLSKGPAVLEFILKNLEDALKETPAQHSSFYVTEDAVNALKAKTLLLTGDKAGAAEAAGKVIGSSYALATTSKDLASTWINGTSSKEIVFALANKRPEDQISLYSSTNDTDGSWNYSMPDDLVVTLYADEPGVREGDMRRPVVLTDNNKARILKFPNGNDGMDQFIKNPDPSQSPLVLIRIAEMYLVKAEAEGNTAAGRATLEEFLKTRYASVSLPSSLTDTQWEDLLLDENLREFFAEGKRWFTVKRMNRLDMLPSLKGRNYLMLWPIPSNQIQILKDKSAYPQNPGYANIDDIE